MSGRVTITKAKEASTKKTIADCPRATMLVPTMLMATIATIAAVVKRSFHQVAASLPTNSEVA
jgi:hypothetical protein